MKSKDSGVFFNSCFYFTGKKALLQEAWDAVTTETQRAIIKVMRMGPRPDLTELDCGSPRDLNHAEALVIVTCLGRTTGFRLASKFYSGNLQLLEPRLHRVATHSKEIGKRRKILGAATIKFYLSLSISNKSLPTYKTLYAGRNSGELLYPDDFFFSFSFFINLFKF